ncbi:hypothetical protein D6C86_05270 [Aureobasidium pullulans]|nr:hypothetical protein D6C86_05270 [Aureobasidium pullulans]THZ66468.1 hypothetical protein D6C88_08236 [Aureobasidium pullulans]
MARSRGSVQKRNMAPDSRRLTRREKLHRLRANAGAASTYTPDWSMEPPLAPLTHIHDRKSRWFARRRRARDHKRKELFEFQLATLDAELSSRVDDVIRANKHTSNVQLPELHTKPMQMVKWEPPALFPVHTPTSRLQPLSDTDWSNLEILFSRPPKKTVLAPLPTPPISLLTATELGLSIQSPPKVRLPELTNNCRLAIPSVEGPVVASWTSKPPVASRIDLNTIRLDTLEYDDDLSSSPFVAAKLPQFREVDPFDLTADLAFEPKPTESEHQNHKPQSTRYDLIEQILEFSRSLRKCEEGRAPAVSQNDSTGGKANSSEVDWSNQPVMDWPYDALGNWNNEPVLDWDGKPAAEWIEDPAVGWSEEVVMIEHDAETYDWTFLSPEDEVPSNCVSMLSSASSSMEFLPLPLRDSFLDDPTAYEEPVQSIFGDGNNMRRVSKSAWETESDFCIPAFFWEGDKSLSEEIFESDAFALYPLCKEDKTWYW